MGVSLVGSFETTVHGPGRGFLAFLMGHGTGTDVAMESAGVTLVKEDLRGIARASLGRATMRNVRQNLFLAFVYNTLGVPVAAGVLYPVLGVLISPIGQAPL